MLSEKNFNDKFLFDFTSHICKKYNWKRKNKTKKLEPKKNIMKEVIKIFKNKMVQIVGSMKNIIKRIYENKWVQKLIIQPIKNAAEIIFWNKHVQWIIKISSRNVAIKFIVITILVIIAAAIIFLITITPFGLVIILGTISIFFPKKKEKKHSETETTPVQWAYQNIIRYCSFSLYSILH